MDDDCSTRYVADVDAVEVHHVVHNPGNHHIHHVVEQQDIASSRAQRKEPVYCGRT